MKREYPNLPLIEERFKNLIADELDKAKERNRPWFAPNFSAELFLQSFPNTAGLFQRSGTVSGQAFSDYYITVMHEENTDIYGVFQCNDPVYLVHDANKNFRDDLVNRYMADFGKAEERY